MKDTPAANKRYFVDEAGDPVLFGGRGRVLVGTQGCSRYFAVGLLDVADPEALGQDLASLRGEILADPYFAGVPSMQHEARKTALFFHAKDDLPEVRREVFRLLQRHDLRFSAVVRDKHAVLEYVRDRNLRESGYRYRPDDLYDHTVRRLFKERLHKHDGYVIHFARRGKIGRTEAFRKSLLEARTRFLSEHGLSSDSSVTVQAVYPSDEPALQAVDYFLWALQRTFERGEDRYLALLWPQCSLVVDADDSRQSGLGVYYTRKRPLVAAALKET